MASSAHNSSHISVLLQDHHFSLVFIRSAVCIRPILSHRIVKRLLPNRQDLIQFIILTFFFFLSFHWNAGCGEYSDYERSVV